MMMDAPSLYPKGFHPSAASRDRGGMFEVKMIPRHKAWGPVRYYIIDFGMSRLYEPGEPHEVVGDEGLERDIPEMSDVYVYDPFPADVFIMGNVLWYDLVILSHPKLSFRVCYSVSACIP